MRLAAGDLDQRITIQVATTSRDAAGDELSADWGAPAGWSNDGRRWARKSDLRGSGGALLRANEAAGVAQQTLREADTMFTLRWDSKSDAIAPETYRVVHHGRVYLIVGLGDTNDRSDGKILLCSSRPDQRGASAPVQASGES